MAGMPPATRIPPLGFPGVRPLLETTRAEVEAFCRALRLRPRLDPTNRDPRFLRNRIRHDVLPVLERHLDRNLRSTLARTAGLVRADADFLEALASEHAHGIVETEEEEVRIHAEALASLPQPIGARVVRQALRLAAAAFGGEWEPDTTATHIEAVLELASGRRARRGIDLPGDLVAERRKEYVRVSRSSPASGGSDDASQNRRAKRSPGGR